MELIPVHRRRPFFQLSTALLLLFCAAAAMRAAQSAGSAKADAASRASATYKQGMSALRKGDLASARADFEQVGRLARKGPEGPNSLGWVLLAQGEIDSAIVHFQTAVKLNPDFALAQMNFSSLLARKDELT